MEDVQIIQERRKTVSPDGQNFLVVGSLNDLHKMGSNEGQDSLGVHS
jgi:hypothetical protein